MGMACRKIIKITKIIIKITKIFKEGEEDY